MKQAAVSRSHTAVGPGACNLAGALATEDPSLVQYMLGAVYGRDLTSTSGARGLCRPLQIPGHSSADPPLTPGTPSPSTPAHPACWPSPSPPLWVVLLTGIWIPSPCPVQGETDTVVGTSLRSPGKVRAMLGVGVRHIPGQHCYMVYATDTLLGMGLILRSSCLPGYFFQAPSVLYYRSGLWWGILEAPLIESILADHFYMETLCAPGNGPCRGFHFWKLDLMCTLLNLQMWPISIHCVVRIWPLYSWCQVMRSNLVLTTRSKSLD